ncbi:MAG TPA: DUF481 domain-containing protein [Burkholderiaceae bacterium]|jgi:putative salt-induced outer membrane protein|nr:DUF481 domain-containing protein [Burkholderiaceae bacterium]
MKSSQPQILVTSALALACLTGPVHAQTQKPDGLWHGSLAGGLSVASGNTRSKSLSLVADTAKETDQDKTTLYGLVLRADNKSGNTTTRTADLMRVGGRYDRVISDRLFGYGGLEFEKDDLQNLRLRAVGTVGLGYKVLRTPSTSFDVFGGAGYVRNDFRLGTDVSGATLQLGEESTHKLSDTATFKQRGVLYPGLKSELGNRATWDASLAAAVSGNWTVSLGYSLRYFSKAPSGFKKTDSLLIAGVGYKF